MVCIKAVLRFVAPICAAVAFVACAVGITSELAGEGAGEREADAAAGTGGLGFIGDGAPNGSGGADACEAIEQTAQDIPLDMLVVVDRSSSMGSKWGQTIFALSSFYGDPASSGISVAMTFFPVAGQYDTCNPNHYDPPHVPLGELPTYKPTLDAAMLAQSATGSNTPMFGALFGSYQWATARQDDHPERKVIVVFASDGQPNFCPGNQNDSAAIAILAQSAYNYNSVQTYVIAIQGSSLTTLNLIALAGGTGSAFDVTSDTTQFKAKMEAIRKDVLGCEYAVPAQMASGEPFDPSLLNVKYTTGAGVELDLKHVADPSACGAGGWYYDSPTQPTKVTLCPATCDQVKQDDDAKVSLLFGCPTVVH